MNVDFHVWVVFAIFLDQVVIKNWFEVNLIQVHLSKVFAVDVFYNRERSEDCSSRISPFYFLLNLFDKDILEMLYLEVGQSSFYETFLCMDVYMK